MTLMQILTHICFQAHSSSPSWLTKSEESLSAKVVEFWEFVVILYVDLKGCSFSFLYENICCMCLFCLNSIFLSVFFFFWPLTCCYFILSSQRVVYFPLTRDIWCYKVFSLVSFNTLMKIFPSLLFLNCY